MEQRLLLLDTDVLSFILRGDPRADLYQRLVAEAELHISFMTYAELRYGALRADWGERRTAHLAAYLGEFAVYHTDSLLLERWASVRAEARARGRPISTPDAWIAATALELDCPLVTHNVRDFRDVAGLRIESLTEH